MAGIRSAFLLLVIIGGSVAHCSVPQQTSVLRLSGGSYHHGVDLKEVVIRGSSSKAGGKKPPSGDAPRPRKKAEDDGPGQSMPHELKVAIMKARQAKNMTQKQLAVQLNVLAQDINWYETGKLVPDNALIARMDRILGELPSCLRACEDASHRGTRPPLIFPSSLNLLAAPKTQKVAVAPRHALRVGGSPLTNLTRFHGRREASEDQEGRCCAKRGVAGRQQSKPVGRCYRPSLDRDSHALFATRNPLHPA